eukprot:TRINITY_DN15473_c0_g1_i1.p1 TRINITY_DN15473_c0_g1~~TRINITY_DN15473_c0_g1_i1.p1  ORF type:complete len:258 (+),score=72.99 TRINITY_DN15473_c0_g1_i1:142-915(+)
MSSADSGDDISPRVIAAVGRDAPFGLMILMDLPSNDADKIAKFKEVAKIAADGSVQEDGCQMYSFYQDVDVPQRYFLVEKWKSANALLKHFAEPHVVPLLSFLEAEKVASNVRVLAPLGAHLIAPVASAANPLPDLAPDRGNPVSVRVAAKQSEDKPFFLAVFGNVPKSDDSNKDHVANFYEAVKTVSAHTSSEEGCKLFEAYVDVDAPTERIVILESWRDVDAIKTHVAKPYMQPWRDALGAAKVKAGFNVGIPLY